MADPETGMEKQRLLLQSKRKPVNVAFGEGAEAGTALLVFNRVNQPKALGKDLVKQFPDTKNPWSAPPSSTQRTRRW